jgi:hypothetical protein
MSPPPMNQSTLQFPQSDPYSQQQYVQQYVQQQQQLHMQQQQQMQQVYQPPVTPTPPPQQSMPGWSGDMDIGQNEIRGMPIPFQTCKCATFFQCPHHLPWNPLLSLSGHPDPNPNNWNKISRRTILSLNLHRRHHGYRQAVN